MKNLEQQTKEIAIFCAVMGGICIVASQLSGCGREGPMGAQGNTGPTGAAGSNCTVTSVAASGIAPNGGSLISCPDGTESLVLNGTTGATGATGLQGPTGANGTIVTAAQFCPGSTSYPNEFNEVGFCIGGNIYAVYSTNDGFLSEVPPGEYSSDGVNSSCTFTIGSNCQVTQN
jgi:hypothetical protein